MKKLILSMMCILPLTSFAGELNIVCERAGIDEVNQFDLVGIVNQNTDYTFINGVFSISMRAQGRDQAEVQATLQTEGAVKVFEAGEMAVNKIIHIQHVEKDADIEYISIVGNHPGQLSSTLRLSSGQTFKSKCSVK